jgi:hypothetical protein
MLILHPCMQLTPYAQRSSSPCSDFCCHRYCQPGTQSHCLPLRSARMIVTNVPQVLARWTDLLNDGF